MSVYSIEVPDCVLSVVCQSLNSLFDRCDFKSGFGENTWSQLLRDLILTNWFMTCFFGKRCQSADMRVTLLSYFSLSWWVSAGGGVCCTCQDLLLHTRAFFSIVWCSHSHDSDVICFCLRVVLDDSSLQTGARGSRKTDSTSGPWVLSGNLLKPLFLSPPLFSTVWTEGH